MFWLNNLDELALVGMVFQKTGSNKKVTGERPWLIYS